MSHRSNDWDWILTIEIVLNLCAPLADEFNFVTREDFAPFAFGRANVLGVSSFVFVAKCSLCWWERWMERILRVWTGANILSICRNAPQKEQATTSLSHRATRDGLNDSEKFNWLNSKGFSSEYIEWVIKYAVNNPSELYWDFILFSFSRKHSDILRTLSGVARCSNLLYEVGALNRSQVRLQNEGKAMSGSFSDKPQNPLGFLLNHSIYFAFTMSLNLRNESPSLSGRLWKGKLLSELCRVGSQSKILMIERIGESPLP